MDIYVIYYDFRKKTFIHALFANTVVDGKNRGFVLRELGEICFPMLIFLHETESNAARFRKQFKDIKTFMYMSQSRILIFRFRTVPSYKTFLNNKNVLSLHCSVW